MPLAARRAPRLRASVIALAITSASVAMPAFADSVDELHALVDANNAAAAWDMAQRMEPENGGDPEFDFWYGLAAKAAGRKHEAVFAFERVVMNQPGNARAKLELGDAYYQFGNTAEARRLFGEVLATTPPEPVQQRIRTYLGALDAADATHKVSVSSFVTLAGGYDTNINSATSVVEHDFGPLTIALDSTSLETEAGFLDARAGVQLVKPVNQRTLRFLGVTAQRRDNDAVFSGGNFDFSQLGVTFGDVLRRGSGTLRIPVSLQAMWAETESLVPVNDDRYVATIGAEYTRTLSSRTSALVFGQAGTTHYASDDARGSRQLLLGGGYVWNAADAPLRLTATAHLGTEPAEEDAFDYNGRDFAALRLNARYALGERQALYGGVGVQQSTYQGDHPALGFERDDMLADLSAGWQVQLDKQWTLNADLSWADNASKDTALFDYQRTQVKLGSTWRF